MNFPLSTAFTVSHRFWVVVFSFSFISMHIFISFFIFYVICQLFSSVLFSLHTLEFLIVFLLYLRYNLTALWSKRMLGMISNESARLCRHRSRREELSHVRGQGQRLRGPAPRPRNGRCAGTGGPRGATPRSKSGGVAMRRYP